MEGDEDIYKQYLVNFLSKSIRQTNKGGRVTLTIKFASAQLDFQHQLGRSAENHARNFMRDESEEHKH